MYPQTLERSYLLKINGKVVERPQHMLMRVAVGIHQRDIDTAIEVHIQHPPLSPFNAHPTPTHTVEL